MKNDSKFYKFLNNENEKILWEGYGDFTSFVLRNTISSKVFWTIIVLSFMFAFFSVVLFVLGYYYYFAYRYSTRLYYILTDKYAYAINENAQYSCKTIPLTMDVQFDYKLSTFLGNTADFTFYIKNTQNYNNFNETSKYNIENFVMQDIPEYLSVVEVLNWVLKTNTDKQEETENKSIAPYAAMANILYKVISNSSNTDLTISDVVNNTGAIQHENSDISDLIPFADENVVEITEQVKDGLDEVFGKEEDYSIDSKMLLEEGYSTVEDNEPNKTGYELLDKKIKTTKKQDTQSFFGKIAKMFDDGKMQDEYDSKGDL